MTILNEIHSDNQSIKRTENPFAYLFVRSEKKHKKEETMPALANYRLFISHSWAYGDAYEKLVSFFNEYPNFKWTDYSVPKTTPFITHQIR